MAINDSLTQPHSHLQEGISYSQITSQNKSRYAVWITCVGGNC